MVKRISAIVFAIFSSVLLLCGCGDPYKDFNLSVSTSEVILYLNETTATPDGEGGEVTETPVDTSLYPSDANFTVKVEGTNDDIGGGITISQYALNGVDDIVRIDMISNDTTSKEGATYKLTALKPGKGVVIVTTNEGNKRHEIVVTVYVPVKSVSLEDRLFALKYGGSLDISSFVTYTPNDTNQKEMTFYIEDSFSANVTKDDKGGVIDTPYASITNGVITAKVSQGYPLDSSGNRYIKVYGVSAYNPNIKTATVSIPVLEIVDESTFDLQTITEAGYVSLTKNNYGYYDLVLGANEPLNQYIYSRNLTVKLSENYNVDKLYAITTNYNPIATSDSVFELDSLVEDQSRYTYTGVKELYPYKSFDFKQMKNGTDILEIYVDRVGYEGLFTITLKIRVIVKDFPTSLTAIDENGRDAVVNGLTLYNAYGGLTPGTGVQVALAPNPTGEYKIRVSLQDCPVVNNMIGISMALTNSTPVFIGDEVDSGTRIFLKHSYDYETIQTQITETGLIPKLVISYTYNTAPEGVTTGYKNYTFTQIIPLTIKTAVSDIRIPSGNSEIKINAVTGKAIMDGVAVENNIDNNYTNKVLEGEAPAENAEIVLATIDNQPVDLAELVSSIKTLSVNGVASDLDPMNNKFFNIVFKQGEYSGMANRLVLEPKLQAEQARIAIEIKTNNNITKTIVIEVFVPITYSTLPQQLHFEVFNETEVASNIYEISKETYTLVLKEGLEVYDQFYTPSEEELELIKDRVTYSTLNAMTLATDTEVGLNLYNYIVVGDTTENSKITRVLYNSNITISQNRTYYTISTKVVNGETIWYLTTKKIKTNGSLSVDVKISGYDDNGQLVELIKTIDLTIIEPITSVSIYPKNTTLYLVDSLGALRENESKVRLSLATTPSNASAVAGVNINYWFDNDILYTLSTELNYVDSTGVRMRLSKSGELLSISDTSIVFDGTNPDIKEDKIIYKDKTGYFYLVEETRIDFARDTQNDSVVRVEHIVQLNAQTGELQAVVNYNAIKTIIDNRHGGGKISVKEVVNNIFSNNVIVTVYGGLKQYDKPMVADSTNIVIRSAKKVEKIIPSTSESGIYFDTRKLTADYTGQLVSFTVLPANAKNKTLIATIADDTVARIVSGVDKDNRIIGNSITIKPNLIGGRTFLRVAPEDDYSIDANTGRAVPTTYIDISIRVANGTEEYPFEISTPNDFMEIGQDIAAGHNSYHYMLRDSFSMLATEFNPFGEFAGGLNGEFSYEMDGVYYYQQNTIYDLTYKVTSTLENAEDYSYGIFSKLAQNAKIQNLILSDVNFDIKLENDSYTNTVNIGVIAGISQGLVANSSVYGNLDIQSNIKNVNAGGVVGYLQSYFEADAITEDNENSFRTGAIVADEDPDNTSNEYQSTNVSITYNGLSTIADSNINLGGVVGFVQTYSATVSKVGENEVRSMVGTHPEGNAMHKDVNVYQYFADSMQTISNLYVSASVAALDENQKPLVANIGGVAGKSSSTLISNVVVSPSLIGYSNIGGIIGFADHSSITNSAVEFANSGVEGLNTIAISGYTNVGGLIGYAKNANISLSYVRAYYNNKPVDNNTYYGNMALLESALTTKNIGGLIGVVEAESISNQLYSIITNDKFVDNGIANYVSTTSSNAIIKSYFNADINTSIQNLSGVVNAGGLVGDVITKTNQAVQEKTETVNPITISDSYVYGSVKGNDVTTYNITNKIFATDIDGNPVEQIVEDVVSYIKEGTVKVYVIGSLDLGGQTQFVNLDLDGDVIKEGNSLIEIVITYTSEQFDIADGGVTRNYFNQYVTYNVYTIAQKLIGSENFDLTQYTQTVGADDEITETLLNTYSLDYIENVESNEEVILHKITSSAQSGVEIYSSYYVINGTTGAVNESVNNLYTIEDSLLKVSNTSTGNFTISNNISRNTVDITSENVLNTEYGFNVKDVNIDPLPSEHDFDWVLCADLNSNYPVLLDPFTSNSLLFKVLPTEIKINVIDILGLFQNTSFVKDGDNLILFYNEWVSGRANSKINRYKLVVDGESIDIDGNILPLNVININMDLVDLEPYGINAIVDKNMIVTSSNESLLEIENNNILVTKGVTTEQSGYVTLTVASKLDTTIKDEIKILIVSGISDFNIYETKNLTTADNALTPIKTNNFKVERDENGVIIPSSNEDVFVNEAVDGYAVGAINQIIDLNSNYFVDIINEDGADLTTSNGVYKKNTNIGVMLQVSEIGNGTAKLNNKVLEKGVTYVYTALDEFVLNGINQGLLYLTLTPFIKVGPGFGSTLVQTATDSLEVENCVLLEKFSKTYKFNVIPRAERPTIDKTSATLDPTDSVNLTISTITSDFYMTANGPEVNEKIYVKITDLTTNKAVAVLPLEMSSEGTNNSLINIQLDSEIVKATEDELKVEYIHNIILTFDTDKYKDRTTGVTFNLNNINYKFDFYAASNSEETGEFNLTVKPKPLTEIKTAYYPNSEVNMEGAFAPQETESDYIVPSRIGLLKIDLSPNYNNAEYVEVTVDDKMKQYVSFVQQVAIMSSDENSYVTGYRDTSIQATPLPDFKGVRLVNESVIVNGANVYYTGDYFLQVVLAEDAPIAETIKFTVTAYKIENRVPVRVGEPNVKELVIQQLPNIYMTVNGQSEGYIAKGSTVELEINAVNFEGDIEIIVRTAYDDVVNVSKIYDIANDKHYVSVGLGATAGDTVIIKAIASRYLNGVLESRDSEVNLYIVEYLIDGVRLEGAYNVNGEYQLETLNGTTNLLNVVFDATYNSKNEDVAVLKQVFEQEASGRMVPSGAGGYINNWWRKISEGSYETLYPNVTYQNYQFADMIMPNTNKSHFFVIKTLAVANTDVIGYKMQYYYNEFGVPTLYTGVDYGYQIFDLSFDFRLIIKDNSTYDHPNPIATVEEFLALGGLTAEGSNTSAGAVLDGHYILVNDLVFDEYYPFDANFYSLDGNGHTIKIKKINTKDVKGVSGSNVGLFKTVSDGTVLKNITVDISQLLVTTKVANQILTGEIDSSAAAIDLSETSSFNFGIIAGTNNGSITNTKVINTTSTNITATDAKKNLLINSTTGYINGSLVEANIGGLVGINNGSISNSYIGLNANNYEDGNSSTELHSNVTSGSVSIATYPFNIVAGKSVAGLVNTNSGIIANSYVMGTGVINTAAIFDGAQTAGFVVTNTNSGQIFNAMVEGIRTTNYRASTDVYLEAKGFIGGFVYSNSGKISNAYSNIYITTNSGGSGGFVYINQNDGVITNAYSTAKNAVNSWAHGQFTGIDDEDNYNNYGTYNSCYYLVFDNEVENAAEPATALNGKPITGNSEVADNQFRDSGSFNGFNFASGNDTNNIWQISETSLHYGPRLISISNAETFSHRVLVHTSNNGQETVYDYEYDTTNYYGKDTNPLLVNSASEFITFIINNAKTMTFRDESGSIITLNVFGVSSSNEDTISSPHSVRLINDLDFTEIQLNNFVVDGKRLSDIAFVGRLDGNGMKMNGVRLVDQNQSTIHENFGMFYQVGLTSEEKQQLGAETVVQTSIMNLNVEILGVDSGQAVKVGTFAGSMYDTSLINVTLEAGTNVFVRGPNLVGGLAGLIVNNEEKLITDVTTIGVSVTSSYSSASGSVTDATNIARNGGLYNGSEPKIDSMISYKSYYRNKTNTITNLRQYSYAGSVAGVIDATNRRLEDTGAKIKGEFDANENVIIGGPISIDSTGGIDNIKEDHRTKPINNFVSKVVVKGGGYISGEHVGGLFGYVGENTHVKNSKYIVGQDLADKESEELLFVQQLVGYNYCGGIVGENYGMLEQVTVEHVNSIQEKLDNAFNTSTVVEGEITNLFGESTSISIGGIAGFTAGGVIVDSYSKIDIINERAKIAGGLVGTAAGRNYIGHVYTLGNVIGKNYVGGMIGFYNQDFVQFHTSKVEESVDANDPNSNTSLVTRKEFVAPKLTLDYAFALNQWSSDLYDKLYNEYIDYYLETGYNESFVIRMPEVGNQSFSRVGVDDDIEFSTYHGSLVGFVNGAECVCTDIEKEEVSKTYAGGEGVLGPNKITNTEISNAITAGRNISLMTIGDNKYIFRSVISTTLSRFVITENDIYYSGSDYVNPLLATESAFNVAYKTNGSDIVEYKNQIGNQLKHEVILGKTGTTESLFKFFKYDAISDDVDIVDNFSTSGSQVWKLEKTFPEYITGIYSNFNKIETATDFNTQIRTASSTKNQYYLLQPSDAKNEIVLASGDIRPNYVTSMFEGTIIGIQKNVEGKDVNPKLVFTIQSSSGGVSTLFNQLSSATLMNVDIEIVFDTTSLNFDITNEDASLELQKSYNGFFAKVVDNSVLNNVNISLTFKREVKFNTTDKYQAFGLAIGYLKDSTLQSSSFTLNETFGSSFTSNNNNSRINFGGLVGESLRGNFANVTVLSAKGELFDVSYKQIADPKILGTISVGSVVGYANDSQFSKINTSTKNTEVNTIFVISDIHNGSTVNYGGLFGNLKNSDVRDAWFVGSIHYDQTVPKNINLRLGGALGCGENTTLEHVNINELQQYVEDKVAGVVVGESLESISVEGHEIKVDALTEGSSTYLTSVGGIVGYGSNLKVRGNSGNKLSSSNNTEITVIAKESNVAVGGIAGTIKNSGGSIDISKSYNVGNIDVTINKGTKEFNKMAMVGGIVGHASGGEYKNIYNFGTVSINSNCPYAVGSILGKAETNSAQKDLTLSRFINFADIYIEGDKPGITANSVNYSRFVGGVAGLIIGSASKFENGYTMTKMFYGPDNVQLGVKNEDNRAINGIAYTSGINDSTFNNVYFVFDFLPYSNFTNSSAQTFGAEAIVDSTSVGKFGGIEYAQLNTVLNSRLSSAFSCNTNSSTKDFATITGGVTPQITLNLPVKFVVDGLIVDMPDVEHIITMSDMSILDGSKLNPIVNGGSTQGYIVVDPDMHYIMSKQFAEGRTVILKSGETFNGVLVGDSRTDYLNIKFNNLINNYGVISNIVVNVQYDSSFATNGILGAFITNNYGNIINCATYGAITNSGIKFSKGISAFVHNNFGNIVQSASMILFASDDISMTGSADKSFSGFVHTNHADGFIKDCYSLTSVINTSSSKDTKLMANVTSVAGFAITNNGVIETSYYAGTLKDCNNVTKVFVHESSIGSVIRNSYYDTEANPFVDTLITKGSTSDFAAVTNYSSVRKLHTAEILSENNGERLFYKSALATKYTPSSWLYVKSNTDSEFNFGYSGINGGIKIPTLLTVYNAKANEYAPDLWKVESMFATKTSSTTKYSAFAILHTGQMNNYAQYQVIESIHLVMITNIDMAHVNYSVATSEGYYRSVAQLDTIMFGMNYIVSNLKITNSSTDSVGLFATISSSGAVKNLVIKNAKVANSGTGSAGILAGVSSGAIKDVIVFSTNKDSYGVQNSSNAGGVIGYIKNGVIENIGVSKIKVNGVNNIGGVVGMMDGGQLSVATIDDCLVLGQTAVGGIIGLGDKSSTGSIVPTISTVTVSNSTIKSEKGVGDAFNAFVDPAYNYYENYSTYPSSDLFNGEGETASKLGGVAGYLNNGAKLYYPTITNKVVVQGTAVVGGIVGVIGSGSEVIGNSLITTTNEDLYVDANYTVGGIAGTNNGRIAGSDGSMVISAIVGNTTSNKNLVVGGVVGSNYGTIYKVTVKDSDIYGSKVFGGLAGISSGSAAKIEQNLLYGTTTGVNIKYSSNFDIDDHDGDMPSLNMGVGSKSSTFSNNNFDTYFGLCGDGAGNIFPADKSTGTNYIEYGGIETRTTGNTNIAGKHEFRLLFGFVAGMNVSGATQSNNTASGDVLITGVYDRYKVYVAQVTSWGDGGSPNWTKVKRRIIPGIRTFNIYPSATNCYTGEAVYNKYSGNLDKVVNSCSYSKDRTFNNGMNALYGGAESNKKDIFNYAATANPFNLTQDEVDDYMSSYGDLFYHRKLKAEVYPGFTWDESNTKLDVDNTQQLSNGNSLKYNGPDKWFTRVQWNRWSGVNFHTGEPSG